MKFYLGKELNNSPLLYDANDLTTHAFCVGMTGSGKTGMCISLLEEAAVAGIPAIVIDPKGDLSNLSLTFPEMLPNDFYPWIRGGEVERRAKALSEANKWFNGLKNSGITLDRIKTMKERSQVSIYTPGSSAGLPLSVMSSFDVPSDEIKNSLDDYSDHITITVSSLLSLLGIKADPLQDPRHIFLAHILLYAWDRNIALDLLGIMERLVSPPFSHIGAPFSHIGAVEVDFYLAKKKRIDLAMKVNGLMASPAFASWKTGESLNIDNLLWTPEGKAKISILSIAHLNDVERMFFVTILLNKVKGWLRTQPGSSSLKALLYFDEIFGYMPPVKEPPSKTILLTLLKQARAFGLGIVLASQNPVDLDYRGLANIGTWFLGRMQTDRDRDKVLDGLAEASAGGDRNRLESLLTGMQPRSFLLNNIHRGGARVFKSRWAMSWLRGPMTLDQISYVMSDQKLLQQAIVSQWKPTKDPAVKQDFWDKLISFFR